MIRDLMAPMRLGDPVVYRRHGGTIYGRIAGLEGDKYDGEYPIIVLRTPGGSEVRAGRIWIAPITTPEDLAALAGFEAHAAAPPIKSEENPMRLESITYECDWCKCREPATWSTHDDDEPPKGWWEIDRSMLCVACQAARKKALEEARAARLNHFLPQGEDLTEKGPTKIAYEAFRSTAWANGGTVVPWDRLPDLDKVCWRCAAEAVAESVRSATLDPSSTEGIVK